MGYGIIRVIPLKKSAIKGIQIHDNRERDSISNPDINAEFTHLNIKSVQCSDYNAAIAAELKQHYKGRRGIRKDATLMTQFMITASPDALMTIDSERYICDAEGVLGIDRYFKDCLEFVQARYGHVISATIHMDEATPHMHVNIVPLTADGRLSHKDLFNPKKLRELQTDFFESVSKGYGLRRGETSDRKHVDTVKYKAQKAQEKIRQADTALDTLQALNMRIKALESREKALESREKALKESIKKLELSEESNRILNEATSLVSAVFDKIMTQDLSNTDLDNVLMDYEEPIPSLIKEALEDEWEL